MSQKEFFKYSVSIFTCLFLTCASAMADCGLTASPNSSFNGSNVETLTGLAIFDVSKNGKVTLKKNGKTFDNLFEDISVAPPLEFFDRNITNRRFFVRGNSSQTFSMQIVVDVTSEKGAATEFRGFTIEETDASGIVQCNVIDSKLIPEDGSIFNAGTISESNISQYLILNDPGQDITTTINATFRGGRYYQIGFTSSRQRGSSTTFAPETYRVLFGDSAGNRIDEIVDGNEDPNEEEPIDEKAEGIFSANSITFDSVTTTDKFDVILESDDDIPDGRYKFKITPSRTVTILNSFGRVVSKNKRKPLVKLRPKKGSVFVNNNVVTPKEINAALSKFGEKFQARQLDSNNPTAVIDVVIKPVGKQKKDFVVSKGITKIILKRVTAENGYVGSDSLLEFNIGDEESKISQTSISAVLDPDVDTPDGEYSFDIQEDIGNVLRDKQELDIDLGNDPLLRIVSIDNNIEVSGNTVTDKGEFTFELTQAGIDLANSLQSGDEILVPYNVISNDAIFASDFLPIIFIEIR